jgi:hypothetical protein
MTFKKLIGLLPLSIILYACPFESTVPMEAKPVEPVDSTLLGYWYGIIRDGSDFFGIEALEITKESDSIYNIIRYGKGIKGDMIMPDTGYFTGYISYIGENRFMNVRGSLVTVDSRDRKNPKVNTQTVYYVSMLRKSNDTLEVKSVTESFSTRKFFNRPEEFKQLVSDNLGKKNIFDEQYSMKYRKIPKPARF